MIASPKVRQKPAAWLAMAMLMATTSPLTAQSLAVSVGDTVMVERPFVTVDNKNFTPSGISGLACMPPAAGARSCLAINDEERFAEWAILKGNVLSPTGRKLQLLTPSDAQTDVIVGKKPENICEKTDSFGEFDGEAVALAGDQIFVIGSHACSRAKGKFKPSAFILARTKATGDAIPAVKVERTWRVSDAIRNSPLAPAYGKSGVTGTNIEGMTVIGDRLYIGFRTPVVQNKATILSMTLGALFADGNASSPILPGVITLELGDNRGIRDLAALDEQRLLVLSGPADASAGAYVLHLYNLSTSKLLALAELRTDQLGSKKGENGGPETAKAETLAIIEQSAEAVTILVMYDNINDGGPRTHRIAMPKE
jgi:Protein of unknown function (DUF3616)